MSNGPTDRQTDGLTIKRTDRQSKGPSNGPADCQTDGPTVKQNVKRTD